MEFEEAANRIHLERSIAFFGSGFSKDATNLLNDEMLPGGALAKRLCDDLNEPEVLPLDLAAQLYEKSGKSPDLQSVIRDFFSTNTVADYQRAISCLPWRRIYTTNYDNVIEKCRRDAGLPVTSPTVLDHPVDFSGIFSIVHLHGFVERLSKEDWDQAYVLTNLQYAADHLKSNGWLEAFRNDAHYADAVFFFGYSLADLDIARLVYENPSLAEKTFIVIGSDPRRETVLRVEGYGTAIKKDVADVAPLFPAHNDERAAKRAPFLSNLVEVDTPPADTAPSRDAVASYLLKGDVDAGYIGRDLANGLHDYFVSRDAINSRADGFGARPERVIIHSNLGEGKTSSLIEINHYLQTAGWTVLWFNGEVDGLEYDIDYLASLDSQSQSKIAVIFENCFAYSQQIKDIAVRFPLISIFLTTRSAALQTRVGNVSDAFGDDYEIIDLSRLTDNEIIDLNDILYATGLWAEKQGESNDKRISYITNNAKSDLATVLVDICRSSDIFKRFKSELAGITAHPVAIRRSLVSTLFLAYAGFNPSLYQVCEIVEADLFKMGKYQADPILAEFIDFTAGRVTVRSPTFAKAVLKEAVADNLIIDILPSLINRLDRLSDQNTLYKEILKSLMRFGVIEGILSDTDKEKKLVAYYEAIRAAGVGLGNPQFWLQYAIACMSFRDYDVADEHFRTAFGLADKRGGYDPYQIENQYARFLIESRTQSNKWGDAYEKLREANEIIARQMSSFTEGYYPYRVARNYLAFVEANDKHLNRTEKDRISEWCAHLLILAANAPDSIKTTAYWRQANERLKQTIDYLAA